MPEVELTLRPSLSAPLETAAWYLPGGAPAEWLEEIATWPIDQMKLRIVVVRGDDGVSHAGALVIPATCDFTPTGRCLPFGKLGKNCYLPSEAELSPALPATEVDDLFSGDYLFVWVPGRGLTAAEPRDVLSLSNFVELPPLNPARWDRAQPGMAFPNHFAGILPEQPESAGDIIQGGRDDIGDRSREIGKLPKSPHEPMSGVAGAMGRAAIIAAAAPLIGLDKLREMFVAIMPRGAAGAHPSSGSGATSSGAFSGLGEIANQMMGRVTKAIEALRHKEIGRLLSMLENDPDQGLKFAIPFDRGGDHRGLASPGSQLGRRDTNFSLGGLGGGGPADYWEMSPEYQQRLIIKYRELAAREIRLGRHRRAAYVYAHLLGDLQSAASALEQGQHFREAAILYRDKLRNPNAAAECLERGELWNEAIEAYQGIGKHEKVGDLLTHIEQREAAAEAYHAAAQESLGKSDLLDAARIYEDKLCDINLALSTLDAAWPNSPQAKKCVTASLTMRGRLGLHADAHDRVDYLAASAEELMRHADVAELLAGAFEQYPERFVRDGAARQGRRLIAGRMQRALRSESERLVAALNRLAPEDRLLRSDGRRYINEEHYRDRATPTQQKFKRQPSTEKLQEKISFNLGLRKVWRAATIVNDSIFVAGVKDGLVFARCDVFGAVETNLHPWRRKVLPQDTPLVLLGRRSPLELFAIGEERLPRVQVFPNSEVSPPLSAGTPNGHGVVWGAAVGSLGQTWAIESRDDPVLVCVDAQGTVVSTQSLLESEIVSWEDVAIPVPLCVYNDRVFIGVGDKMLTVRNGVVVYGGEYPYPITALSGGGAYAAPIVAVSMERGGVIMRMGFEGYLQFFADELRSPQILRNQGGFVIAADSARIEVYESIKKKSGERELTLRSAMAHVHGRPIALLATPQSDRFIMVTNNGVVTVYEIGN